MAKRGRSRDAVWRYGECVGESKHQVKCNYCHRVVCGGITQFKKHFVGTIGGTGPCASAPEEVREMIKQKFSEKRTGPASTGKLDACNKRTDKIMTRLALMKLSTSRNVQPEFVSDPPLCIPSKKRGIGKRKQKDSKQQKKSKTSGNVQTESLCDSPLSVPSMEQDIRKRNRIDSKQQKKLTTYGNVQTESASDPPPCIPSKELGRGKRKHMNSEQQKKLRTYGNVQTVSASDPLGIPSKEMGSGKRKQIDSQPKKKCTASKEGTRETKGMDSKQQKKQGSSKEDSMQSFYVSYFPRYRREKKLRGIKERYKNSDEQKKLDTNAFESFLEYLWSKLSDVKGKTCTYFDCLWFSLYMDGPSQSKVLTWIKKKQIFSRKYVFVPIICWGHWSLLILCHFGESFLSKTRRPCLLLLDSLGNINPMRLEPDIRRFVFDIYKSEGCEDEESISKIPLLVPKVPQQRDGEKCGIFVLYFIHLFLQDAPEAFNQEGYPYFLTENWFSYEDVENFHKEVLHFATTSDAKEETVPWLDEASLGEAALTALPDRQGLLAEASRMEESPAQIVEKSPFEVAPHVDSTPVVSEEGGVAETESMAMDIQPIELESTPVDFPPVSEKEPSSAVEPGCMAISSLVDGAPEVPRSFPALGIEWPDGPHFGVMLRSPEVAAELAQSLDLLLQIDPLLTIEAMRSRLVECTRGYHAFGLPRDAWMAKLVSLWDEFACLHATQEQRQKIQMMIQQEEEQLCRLRATQAEVYAQAEAARELGCRASLRVEELQRDLRQAQEECSRAQTEAATLQCKVDGLHGEVFLREARIAHLRRSELRS